MSIQLLNKPKLLFTIEVMWRRVFTSIVDWANALVNEYDLHVAYTARKQTPPDYRNYFDEKVQLIKFEKFERSDAVKDFSTFFEIKEIASKLQFDIIHLRDSKAGALGQWAFDEKKILMFYTPHSYIILMNDHSRVKRIIYKIAFAMAEVRFFWIRDGEPRNELAVSNVEITGWLTRENVIQETVNGYVCRNTSEFVDGINGDRHLNLIAREDVIKVYNIMVMAKEYSHKILELSEKIEREGRHNLRFSFDCVCATRMVVAA